MVDKRPACLSLPRGTKPDKVVFSECLQGAAEPEGVEQKPQQFLSGNLPSHSSHVPCL